MGGFKLARSIDAAVAAKWTSIRVIGEVYHVITRYVARCVQGRAVIRGLAYRQ